MASVEPSTPRFGQAAESQPRVIKLFYFIGRCNPPHDGHIYTLAEMIRTVMKENDDGNYSKACIILGDGPYHLPGERLPSDPIEHALKERVIIDKLTTELGLREDELQMFCEIRMKENLLLFPTTPN